MYVVRTRTYVCILPNLIYDANIQRGRIDDLFDNSIFEWEEGDEILSIGFVNDFDLLDYVYIYSGFLYIILHIYKNIVNG